MNQVPFLATTSSLAASPGMNMDMSGAEPSRAVLMVYAFKSLVKITGLGNVEWNPLAAFRLFGNNVIGGLWFERSAHRINLIRVVRAGLAGPIERRDAVRFVVTAKQLFNQVHLGLITSPEDVSVKRLIACHACLHKRPMAHNT